MSNLLKSSNPPTIREPFGNYVHSISVPAGYKLMVTSGQLGASKDDATPESAADQARICFHNIQEILAQHHMTFANIVKVNGYLTSRDYFADYMAVRDEFIPDPVCSTLLIVSGFTRPEFKVEVEITAVAPSDAIKHSL